MDDPAHWTPAWLEAAGRSLAVHCPGCRVVRVLSLPALIAAGRGDTPIPALRFRCETCRGPGSALVDWRAAGNLYSSYDYATRRGKGAVQVSRET